MSFLLSIRFHLFGLSLKEFTSRHKYWWANGYEVSCSTGDNPRLSSIFPNSVSAACGIRVPKDDKRKEMLWWVCNSVARAMETDKLTISIIIFVICRASYNTSSFREFVLFLRQYCVFGNYILNNCRHTFVKTLDR